MFPDPTNEGIDWRGSTAIFLATWAFLAIIYHLDTGSSAWLDGTCIGRLSKAKDQYHTEAGELLPLQAALESLVRNHLKQSAGVELV